MIKRLGNYKTGFKYVYLNGDRVKDLSIIYYLKSLKIPPAYQRVHIYSNKNAKIIAYGYDSKNRKQSIYNKTFIEKQAQIKFNRYFQHRDIIKNIVAKIHNDIKSNDPKIREIAMVLLLIIECGFRIGNRKYLKENNSYGITTINFSHIQFDNNRTIIEFVGKKGVINRSICYNKTISNYLKLKKMYSKRTDRVFTCSSSDVNSYLKELDPDITSKDLRTWNANELFIKFVNSGSSINDSIKMVAEKLHNTPAVCKKNYIDPEIIEYYNIKTT